MAMVLSLLNNPAFVENMVVLLVILGLLGSGLAMLVIGARKRAEALSRRVDKVSRKPRASTAEKGESIGEAHSGERLVPRAVQGLTDVEHRQVIRIYAKLGASAEQSAFYLTVSRLVLALILGGGSIPALWASLAKTPQMPVFAAVAVVAAGLGWFLPIILVRRSIAKHFSAVSSGLPDALELLAVCVEVGLSLENALQRVARELRRSQPDIAEELALTWAEFNILPNRDQALLNLADRVAIPSVRSVVTTLSQTLRYGTPLAKSLRVVAADVRNDQLALMEEKANRLPAMMTVPVMLFIMPTIFLIVGGPAALKMMDMLAQK